MVLVLCSGFHQLQQTIDMFVPIEQLQHPNDQLTALRESSTVTVEQTTVRLKAHFHVGGSQPSLPARRLFAGLRV